MKLRTGASRGAAAYYKLIGAVHLGDPVQPGDASLMAPHGKRDRLLRAAEKYAFARDTPVWPELGRPFQLPDGQWRAAYAHGQSVPLTDSERDELIARHSPGDTNGKRQDSPPEPLELQERPEAEG